jgi:predicted SAM-dependent methyltransferase
MSVTYTVARKLARRTMMLVRQPPLYASLDRELVANEYLRGAGIEIGALHHPLRVPRSATVTYVDRMTEADLRKQYPELRDEKLVPVEIVDDGEHLATIPDSSQDFVIANHFLEHCQNPVGALRNMLRVLKQGAVLYLAVPDKRYTFDIDRPLTSIEHVLRDDAEGADGSKRQHFVEWVRLVNKVEDPAEAEKRIAHLMSIDYSIHYHVWTQSELLELLLALKNKLRFEFEIELFLKRGCEVIAVLSKIQ